MSQGQGQGDEPFEPISPRLLRSFARAMSSGGYDGVYVFDERGVFTDMSPAAAAIVGETPEELIGFNGWKLFHPDDLPAVQQFNLEMMSRPGPHGPLVVRVRHKSGKWVWAEMNVQNLLDDPEVHGIVGFVRDVTQRKVLERQLEEQATTNAVTGLPNRAALMDRLAWDVAPGHEPVTAHSALLIIDLDNFASTNNSLGRAAGDEVLRESARRIRQGVRPWDLLAHIGDDSFAVVLDSVGNTASALDAAHRLALALEEPFRTGAGSVSLTASVGIALTPATDATTLVDAAEAACHTAKELGRGRVAVFDAEALQVSRRRIALATDLREALESEQLELHYQPEVDLATGRVLGVEALLRREQPGFSATEAVSVAESSGLAVALGRWVVGRATAFGARWAREHRSLLRVSVNASAHELADPSYTETVRLALAESGFDPRLLVVEITETALLSSDPGVADRAKELRSLGVVLSIDDFGTGFSSLSHLKQLPVQELKVDRSFVAGLGVDADDSAIVGGVISLSRSLGVSVVAEGVENLRQLRILRELGCEVGQGYFWSPAVRATDLDRVLSRIGSGAA
jgi:diguanylate cyclase (GGDEF)-like protein/PAS domain S-box-containing protein